jgi:hypothetical protein
MSLSQLQYKVLLTPLIAKNTYGDTIDITQDIDVSDFVTESGIGKIKNEIDNGDYEFGIFSFGDISLTLINYDGRFNDESSAGTIFKWRRDLAKVKVTFVNNQGTANIAFEGIINDAATRQDFNAGTVKVKVLSLSSIFRTTKISGGLITNGLLFSDAIKNILNITDIRAILNYDESKVSVGIDRAVDVGSIFDGKTVKEGLNNLLLASNSILYIDDTNTVNVSTRAENINSQIASYYGGNDLFGRENVLSIKNFNNGLHRMFNNIIINGQSSENNISINSYGIRQKSISLDFITNNQTAFIIADAIINEFSIPKVEMEITVRTQIANTISLLQLVLVNIGNLLRPANGDKFFPIYGVSKYGESKYPHTLANVPIRPIDIFKVIGIYKKPNAFTTTLKLRGTGKVLVFDEIMPVYGEAIYGLSKYQGI